MDSPGSEEVMNKLIQLANETERDLWSSGELFVASSECNTEAADRLNTELVSICHGKLLSFVSAFIVSRGDDWVLVERSEVYKYETMARVTIVSYGEIAYGADRWAEVWCEAWDTINVHAIKAGLWTTWSRGLAELLDVDAPVPTEREPLDVDAPIMTDAEREISEAVGRMMIAAQDGPPIHCDQCIDDVVEAEGSVHLVIGFRVYSFCSPACAMLAGVRHLVVCEANSFDRDGIEA